MPTQPVQLPHRLHRPSPFSAETTAELIRLAQQHHLTFLAVFGSIARGTATPYSFRINLRV